MAALTWRNVDAPSFSGANDLFRLASQNFNSAAGMLDSSLGTFQEARTTADSNKLALEVMKYQDPAAYEAALASGQITAGVNPRNINAATLDFMNQHKAGLLAEDKSAVDIQGGQLDNQGQNIQNKTSAFNLDQGQQEAARLAEQRAALPAANKVMAQVQALVDSGDPLKLQQARNITQQNVDLLTKSGIDPLKLMDKNNATFNSAMEQQKTIQGNSEFWDGKKISQDAKDLVKSNLGKYALPQNMLEAIRSSDADPRAKIEAMKDVTDNAAIYFKPIDPVDAAVANIERSDPSLSVPKTTTTTDNKTVDSSSFIKYNNQNATRNKPLSNKMVKAMSFLPELESTMEVFSGGQDSTGPDRVGSHRHDDGNAGDVFFYRKGKKLDPKNPADLPYLIEIVKRAKANGITGIGAGDGYMQDGSMHIGFGDPAIWGKDGDGKNVAPWLKNAWNGTPQGTTLGEAPIDVNKPQLKNPDGTVSTEQTITIKNRDQWVNIPTVVNGQKLADAQAVQLFNDGKNPAVGRFEDLDKAEKAAQARSEEIGKQLEKAAAKPIQRIVENTLLPTPEINAVPEVNSKALSSAAQDTATQAALDRASNTEIALDSKIANPPNADSSLADIVKKLTTKGGTLEGMPETAVTDAIEEIRQRAGVSPATAAVLAADSIESRDMIEKNVFGTQSVRDFLFGTGGDKYGGPTEGSVTKRINTDKAVGKYDGYNKRTNGARDLSEGVARQNMNRDSKAVATEVTRIQSLVSELDNRLLAAEEEAKVNPQAAQNLEAIKMEINRKKQVLLKQLIKLQPNSTAYTSSNTNN